MATIEIPVRNDIFAYSIKVTLENLVYTLRFRWNSRIEKWVMDVNDGSDEPLLSGLILFTGIPLTHRFIGVIEGLPPGQFMMIDETGQDRDADKDTFGNDVKLIYTESE